MIQFELIFHVAHNCPISKVRCLGVTLYFNSERFLLENNLVGEQCVLLCLIRDPFFANILTMFHPIKIFLMSAC